MSPRDVASPDQTLACHGTLDNLHLPGYIYIYIQKLVTIKLDVRIIIADFI